MADKVEGYLEVGFNERGEVVINLDRDRTGHVVFSPNQARSLASLLAKKADEAQRITEGQAPHIIGDCANVKCPACGAFWVQRFTVTPPPAPKSRREQLETALTIDASEPAVYATMFTPRPPVVADAKPLDAGVNLAGKAGDDRRGKPFAAQRIREALLNCVLLIDGKSFLVKEVSDRRLRVGSLNNDCVLDTKKQFQIQTDSDGGIVLQSTFRVVESRPTRSHEPRGVDYILEVYDALSQKLARLRDFEAGLQVLDGFNSSRFTIFELAFLMENRRRADVTVEQLQFLDAIVSRTKNEKINEAAELRKRDQG